MSRYLLRTANTVQNENVFFSFGELNNGLLRRVDTIFGVDSGGSDCFFLIVHRTGDDACVETKQGFRNAAWPLVCLVETSFEKQKTKSNVFGADQMGV
jgi:hypothetical protein